MSQCPDAFNRQTSATPTITELAHPLTRAAGAMARLDEVAASHPLRPAFLYRTRLDAVRRQAAVDGMAIDPWHLAAILEGLRLRMDGALRIIDRGAIFDAARHALLQHQWLTEPNFDQEEIVHQAEAVLATAGVGQTPLLAAADGIRAWIDRGGDRPPARSALVRYWRKTGVLRLPIPITGAAAFGADVSWKASVWIPAFLSSLAKEAEDWLDLLIALERAWFSACAKVAGRRRNSHCHVAEIDRTADPVIAMGYNCQELRTVSETLESRWRRCR